MDNTNKQNLSASGSASIGGGEYGTIRISGSARSSAPVTCDTMHVSGSAHLGASLTAGECRVSGSCHINGALTAENMHVSGSCNVQGDAEANHIAISGSMLVGGALHGGNGRFSGGVNAGKDIEFESLNISGSVRCGGLLNADKLHIKLGGDSVARDIGGDEIKIEKAERDFIRRLFGSDIEYTLTVQSIEGTRVSLEYTRCATVRGKDVEIGEGCVIERVEYENSLSVAEGAQVGERVKV